MRIAFPLFSILFAILAGAAVALPGIDQIFQKPAEQRSWGLQAFDYVRALATLQPARSYALVVGISEFTDFNDLPVDLDPYAVKDFLLDEEGFDYVHVLTEEAATNDRVRQIMIDELPARITPKDRFVFYWVGHGHTVQNRRGDDLGYLATATAKANELSRMVSMEDLQDWDLHIPAGQALYLIDSCFSGHAGILGQSGRDLTLEQFAGPVRQLITAGTKDQSTFATETPRGSVFTRAVLEGLRGRADASTPGFPADGVISMHELVEFVKKRVETEVQQRGWRDRLQPQLWPLEFNEGEFFFVSSEHRRTQAGAASAAPMQWGDPIAMSTEPGGPATAAPERGQVSPRPAVFEAFRCGTGEMPGDSIRSVELSVDVQGALTFTLAHSVDPAHAAGTDGMLRILPFQYANLAVLPLDEAGRQIPVSFAPGRATRDGTGSSVTRTYLQDVGDLGGIRSYFAAVWEVGRFNGFSFCRQLKRSEIAMTTVGATRIGDFAGQPTLATVEQKHQCTALPTGPDSVQSVTITSLEPDAITFAVSHTVDPAHEANRDGIPRTEPYLYANLAVHPLDFDGNKLRTSFSPGRAATLPNGVAATWFRFEDPADMNRIGYFKVEVWEVGQANGFAFCRVLPADTFISRR